MEYIHAIMPDGELRHWGIKGMQWGKRRYQNKDGSLTPAGKKRYSEEVASLKAREKSIKARERAKVQQDKLDAKKAELDERERALNGSKKNDKGNEGSEQNKQKSIKDMSDYELLQEINRARLEDTYRQLRPEARPKPSFMNKMMDEVVKPAMLESGKAVLKAAADKAVKELLKDKVKIDPDSIESLKKEYDRLKIKKDIDDLKKGDSKTDPDSVESLKKEYDRLKIKKDIDDLKKGDSKTDSTPSLDDLLEPYRNMSDETRNELEGAAKVQGNINKLLNKNKDKNKDKN